MDNPNCDGSGPHASGAVRVLPYGGDGNLILCHSCYMREMQYRRERNRELGQDCQFELPAWNDLRVYGGEVPG
jgi:hypothetical protein